MSGRNKTCRVTDYSYEKSKRENRRQNGYLGHMLTVMRKKETNAAGKALFACVPVRNMTCMTSQTHTHTHRHTPTESDSSMQVAEGGVRIRKREGRQVQGSALHTVA